MKSITLYVDIDADPHRTKQSYYSKRFRWLNKVRVDKIIYFDGFLDFREDIGGIVWTETTSKNDLKEARLRKIPCMFCDNDIERIDRLITSMKDTRPRHWSRISNAGYEVTTLGDQRFSPWLLFYKDTNLESYYQLVVKGGNILGYHKAIEMKGKPAYFVTVADEPWTRESVKADKDSLYIFTDNLGRSSGYCRIESGWYKDKYGPDKILNYPTITQACIRGLDNAYPITTMIDSNRTQITESDLKNIFVVWSDEIDSILKAYKTGNYRRIIVSPRIFGAGRYSRMREQCPKAYYSLSIELRRLGIDNFGDEVVSNYPELNLIEEFETCYMDCILQFPELIVELIELTKDRIVLTDRFATSEISQANVLSKLINSLLFPQN